MAKAPRAKRIPLALRKDDWANVSTGLGVASFDKRMNAGVARSYRWAPEELLELYKGDAVAALIIDDRAKEMLRKWFTLQLEGDDGGKGARAVLDALDGVDSKLALRQKLYEWITRARRDGGAGLYLGVDDGQTPDKPIAWENVRSFDFVTVLDRWALVPYSYYANKLQPKYGEVAQYQLSNSTTFGAPAPDQKPASQTTQFVHSDRILAWHGVKLSPEEMLRSSGWGDSVLTRTREILRDDAALWQSLTTLMSEYSTAIMKQRGLAEALVTEDGPEIVRRRMQGLQLARSVARITLLDAGSGMQGDNGEEWSRDTVSVAGVADMIDCFMQRVAMAARMPMSRLFGVTPGGLGDKGGSDLQWYHEDIERDQEVDLRPQLNKIIRLMMRAQDGPLKGQEPETWSIKFNPLRQLNALEEAQLRKTTAETDAIYLGAGVLDPREVANSRFGGPVFSTETQLDEEVRELMDEQHQAAAEAALAGAERARDGEEPEEKKAPFGG
jgi:uncharacterized protein